MRSNTATRIVLVVLLIVAAPATVWGHEGHRHHLMGTVDAVDASHLDLTTTEGKPASVAITPDTKVFRGKTPTKIDDIKKGARVMIETDGAPAKPKALIIHLGTDAK